MSFPIFQGKLINHRHVDPAETLREFLGRVRQTLAEGRYNEVVNNAQPGETLLEDLDQILDEIDLGERDVKLNGDKLFSPCYVSNDQWLEICPDGTFEIGVPAG